MPSWAFGRLFSLLLAVSLPACLDFDQYGEGGGAGGESAGGAPAGGSGGGVNPPTCPSDPVVPAAVCITGAPYDFNGDTAADWALVGTGQIAYCGSTCANLTINQGRLDVRSRDTAVVSECFASIDVVSSDARRVFLELAPDGEIGTGTVPLPDLANNIEIGVEDNSVRFEVGATALPALVLDEGVTVDQLRIQVRADTVVLEAFSGGQQVACSEQERPDLLLSAQMRAGFGIAGSQNQQAQFDNYGGLAD